jgi:hypothetical protein
MTNGPSALRGRLSSRIGHANQLAHGEQQAGGAMRPQPCADRLAEWHQALVQLQPIRWRKDMFQRTLALLWGFRVDDTPAIRNPMNVNIDR